MSKREPGFLRQIRQAKKDFKKWPKWMREQARFAVAKLKEFT